MTAPKAKNKGLFGLHAPQTQMGPLEPINKHMQLHARFSELRRKQEEARPTPRLEISQSNRVRHRERRSYGPRIPWTEEEDEIVRTHSGKEACELLERRTYTAVISRRKFLKIQPRRDNKWLEQRS